MSDTDARLLADKAVIVTGAGRGLGRAYAHSLAAHGAAVVVNDIARELCDAVVGEIRDSGGTAHPNYDSVSEGDSSAALIAACTDTFGHIYGLVNNAGVFYGGMPLELDEREMRLSIEVNVLGTIFCGTHAIRAMTEAGSGRIVNISSRAHLGRPRTNVYGATRGAVTSLTYGWAIDLYPTIAVNAVAPQAKTTERPGYFKRGLPSHPPPEKVAPIVTFLMSDLSEGITGQVFRMSGPELGVFLQPKLTPERMLLNENWDVHSVAEAIGGPLKEMFEPIGVSFDLNKETGVDRVAAVTARARKMNFETTPEDIAAVVDVIWNVDQRKWMREEDVDALLEAQLARRA